MERESKKSIPILTTTGVARSSCMFCMYGIHLESEPNRFKWMAVTHPKQYDYCIYSLGGKPVPLFLISIIILSVYFCRTAIPRVCPAIRAFVTVVRVMNITMGQTGVFHFLCLYHNTTHH